MKPSLDNKILHYITILFISLSLLTGCGGGGSNNSNTGSGTGSMPLVPLIPANTQPLAPLKPADKQPWAPLKPADTQPLAPLVPADKQPLAPLKPADKQPLAPLKPADKQPLKPLKTPVKLISFLSQSPTVTLIANYPQKIVVLAADIYGNHRILTSTDGLKLSVEDSAVASISESGVLSNKVEAGTSFIVAQYDKFRLQIPLVVEKATLTKINVTAGASDSSGVLLPNNYNERINAIGLFSDGQARDISNYVNLWHSSNPDVVNVYSSVFGTKIYGSVFGSGTVYASLNGVESSISVNVINARLNHLEVSPGNSSVLPMKRTQLAAVGDFSYKGGSFKLEVTHNVNWSVSESQQAYVDHAWGIITPLKAGVVTVNAIAPDGFKVSSQLKFSLDGLISVSALPSTLSITKGLTQSLKIYASYTDGNKTNVTNLVTFKADNQNINFSTSDGELRVTAVREGDTTLIASYEDGVATIPVHVTKALIAKLELSPVTMNLALGQQKPLILNGLYTDGTSQIFTTDSAVKWNSTNPQEVNVVNGIAHALMKTGSTAVTVNAGLDGFQSNPVVISVGDSIINGVYISGSSDGKNAITSINLHKGNSQILYPYAKYTDNHTAPLTNYQWIITANDPISVVNNTIIASKVGVGSLRLQHTVGAMCESSVAVNVTAAIPEKIIIDQADGVKVPLGKTLQFHASSVYSDGTSIDVTKQALWNISPEGNNSIDNGSFAAHEIGQVTVSASISGDNGKISTNKLVEVTAAQLEKISLLLPANEYAESNVIVAGTSRAVIANGYYSDGSVEDITSQIPAWYTSNGLGNMVNTNGKVQLVAKESQGETTISTPAYYGISASLPVKIIPVAPVKFWFWYANNPSISCNRSPWSGNICATNAYVKFNNGHTDYLRNTLYDGLTFTGNPEIDHVELDTGALTFYYSDSAVGKDGEVRMYYNGVLQDKAPTHWK